jgi:HD-GYP domain-containing protein (c-di-GMP phosphodiesterase class II)
MDTIVREHLERVTGLQSALLHTIEAVSLAIEERDQYSAGHQRRVAKLSSAIGRQMGWSPERIDGVYLGSVVHDIGELTVPLEILAYPGDLTAHEFDIIRRHPEIGYDILKDVPFPWPIAEMVLQHHERLDGSGYPNGLKNGHILQESRIMAVADVVAAMAAPRPHRPAYDIDTALAHVTEKRGVWYDEAAVDACVQIFSQQGFTFH